MEKTKCYNQTRFSADVIQEAIGEFRRQIGKKELKDSRLRMNVDVDDSNWSHDNENEFFSDYRRSNKGAVFQVDTFDSNFRLQAFYDSVDISVGATDRGRIEAVFEVFERSAIDSRLPDPPKKKQPIPRIFIGHGRNIQWRDLKDHLQDKHKLHVEAYEIGARAGHTIRDVLEEMLNKSSFALLVMAGEDETKHGNLHVRQNVVHEAGLFQGRLGFNRAIVLLEESAKEFSNIHGIEQIRFSKGNIKETFGEILATIKREFGDSLA